MTFTGWQHLAVAVFRRSDRHCSDTAHVADQLLVSVSFCITEVKMCPEDCCDIVHHQTVTSYNPSPSERPGAARVVQESPEPASGALQACRQSGLPQKDTHPRASEPLPLQTDHLSNACHSSLPGSRRCLVRCRSPGHGRSLAAAVVHLGSRTAVGRLLHTCRGAEEAAVRKFHDQPVLPHGVRTLPNN